MDRLVLYEGFARGIKSARFVEEGDERFKLAGERMEALIAVARAAIAARHIECRADAERWRPFDEAVAKLEGAP
jgi:hypothetical protein